MSPPLRSNEQGRVEARIFLLSILVWGCIEPVVMLIVLHVSIAAVVHYGAIAVGLPHKNLKKRRCITLWTTLFQHLPLLQRTNYVDLIACSEVREVHLTSHAINKGDESQHPISPDRQDLRHPAMPPPPLAVDTLRRQQSGGSARG